MSVCFLKNKLKNQEMDVLLIVHVNQDNVLNRRERERQRERDRDRDRDREREFCCLTTRGLSKNIRCHL